MFQFDFKIIFTLTSFINNISLHLKCIINRLKKKSSPLQIIVQNIPSNALTTLSK